MRLPPLSLCCCPKASDPTPNTISTGNSSSQSTNTTAPATSTNQPTPPQRMIYAQQRTQHPALRRSSLSFSNAGSPTPCSVGSGSKEVIASGSGGEVLPENSDKQKGSGISETDATQCQSIIRGQQQRKKVSINTVADGIVHVRIQGDAETFSSVGINGLDTSTGPKKLDYLSVSLDKYAGRVAGGDKVYKPVVMNGKQLAHVLRSTPDSQSPVAYVNGGYFNSHKRTSSEPAHIPIGKTVIAGQEQRFLPIPEGFEPDYRTVSFPDGSKLTSGPVLYENGTPQFPPEKMTDKKYQFKPQFEPPNTGESPLPGHLYHADQRNRRSAIIIPGNDNGEDFKSSHPARLAVSVSGSLVKRAESAGFTMPEWSMTTSRLASMSETGKPAEGAIALNLDGGGSTTMGVINAEGEKILEIRATRTPAANIASNFVTYEKKDEKK